MRYRIKISTFWKPIFLATGVPSDDAFVELDSDSVRIKMGIWFDERLPLREIESVDRSRFPWYGGLGVKLGPTSKVVSVVGSLENVVAIRLHRPLRMRVLVPVHREEVRVSLEDADGFIQELRRAIASNVTPPFIKAS